MGGRVRTAKPKNGPLAHHARALTAHSAAVKHSWSTPWGHGPLAETVHVDVATPASSAPPTAADGVTRRRSSTCSSVIAPAAATAAATAPGTMVGSLPVGSAQ
ncbi:MAG: hypothetical protein BRC32_07465 [Actinobacteria bacterium QS_8_72_14]|nr:MAG: hypothetical protein BRC32_07465 [Actinobacteria bacterium QS_8_72_14]